MKHGATLDGRTLGARGAAAALRTPAEQAGRPTARVPARGVHGGSVRAPDGHAVAVSPAGDVLRQRIDLLAALQVLDRPIVSLAIEHWRGDPHGRRSAIS